MVIYEHILGYPEHQHGYPQEELECTSVLSADIQLLTRHCTSKLEYDNVKYDNVRLGPNDILYDVFEGKYTRDCHSCPDTDDIQGTPTADKVLFSFEVPLFCDEVLSLSAASIRSLTRANDVTAAQIPQQGYAQEELECPSMFRADIQLLMRHCTSKLEYHNVILGPNDILYDVLEGNHIREITSYDHSCTGTDDMQEISTPDKAFFTFEVPLFCDEVPSLSAASIHSLTCTYDVTAAQIPLESLSGGLSADCFESLIVMPELMVDDKQFQSIPIPRLSEWSSAEVQLATVTTLSLNCRPSPVTATDWLYLDWHFTHGRTCNDAECFKLRAKLEDNYKPTKGFINIRVNASEDWSKVALKVVELESSPRRGIRGTGEEFTFNAKDYDEPNSAQQAPLVSHYGRDANRRLHQAASTIEAGERKSFNVSAVKKENFRPRSLEVPMPEADFSSQDTPTQRTSFQTHTDTLQKFEMDKPAVQAIVAEEFTCKLPELQDAERSSRNRSPGSALDDLACFVFARKGVVHNNSSSDLIPDCEGKPLEITDNVPKDPLPEITSVDDGKKSLSSFTHAIKLSVEILALVDTLASDYHRLIAVNEILGKDRVRELDIPERFGFDSQGNTRLMTLIKKIASEQPTQQRQVSLRGLTALHVLRHTALNLCTYGIQVAHLYLENLFDRIRFLEELILNSRVELEDAYNKVERGFYEDHPKLHHLEKLLKGRTSSEKILLIADRRAFFTFYKKLLSSGFTPYQIDRKEQYLRGLIIPDIAMKLREDITHALSFSNCLLVSCAYITDSFPVENFTLIIVYAYSGTNAAVEAILKGGRCELHILKDCVNPENMNVLTAYETSQIQPDDDVTIKQAQDRLSNKILRLLEPTDNTADPPEGTSRMEVRGQESSRTVTTTDCDPRWDWTQSQRGSQSLSSDGHVIEERLRCTGGTQFTETGYEMILVANISQQSGQKLTERRSSYQKILCLEKQKIQVVERELRLPVDLLLSPSICLVIYTRSMFGKVPQSLNDEQSLLRTEVDIILRAISFAYRDCILIFEGPADFTSAVLDVLCDIHAMAIWLELEVQYFISDGVEITDKIIMKCIEAARQTKLLKLYPAMTETPTFAEVFLTEFPTINPLTAHAVLSSGCPLRTFFSMSLEQQYALVQESGVPRHSLELFKAQCTYREVGNSVHSDPLGFGSQFNHHRFKFDGKGDFASSNCERIMSLTNLSGDNDLLTHGQREAEADDTHLPVPASMFESWSSYPDLPTVFEEDGNSQMKNSRKTVSFVEAECFPEFPPASEVTGDLTFKATGMEMKDDNLPPDLEYNIFGPQSTEDQDLFLPEGKSNEFFSPHDDYLPLCPPERFSGGPEERFIASLDKLKASLSSWDDHGRDQEDWRTSKVQQSYRKLDCGSPLAPGPLASSGEFYSFTCENGGKDVTQSSSILTVPFRFKSTCNGQLLQTSLDRYRYQPKDSRASGILPMSMKFPRTCLRNQERQLPNPKSSIFTSYVPVDKRPKKLLGLTRRGSDRQQRLVWINKNNDIHDLSKRQKKDPTYSI